MQALDYARELIRFDSTSQRSNVDVTDYAESVLKGLGCETERVEHRDRWGILKASVIGRKGSGPGGLAYFGHTDVVPSDTWSIADHGPFEPTVRDDRLYGRGSTDMKGSVACFLAAVDAIQNEALQAPVYVSCTADEELDHRGAEEIIANSRIYRDLVNGGGAGIVGEPTSLDVVYAHKGGCQIVVTSHGKAAHSSTREGVNANMAMIPFLQDVKAFADETENDAQWHDLEFSPPTLCVNVGINDHNPAVNITSPRSVCTVCFRPMPQTDVDALINRIRESAERHALEFELRGRNSAFHRDPRSDYVATCRELTAGTAGTAVRTVGYGSEAGNFKEVENLVVLGPGDIAQAHKDDEWISLEQLEAGQSVYTNLIRRFCLG